MRNGRGIGARQTFMLRGLALFLAAAFAAPAGAQVAPEAEGRRSPLWYGITLGGAGMRLSCDLCQPTRDVGPAVTVSAGAYGTDRLRVGLEASGWTYEDGSVRERMYGLGLVAHLTPSPRRGLFLLGGFGWSGYRAGDLTYDAPRVTLGVGWDVPVFGTWVVGNVLSLDGAGFAGLRNEGVTVVRNVGLSHLRFGVQLLRR
jgi:hypothetical protein